MKTNSIQLINARGLTAALLFLGAVLGPLNAQTSSSEKSGASAGDTSKKPSTQASRSSLIRFNKPAGEAPSVRVTGGSRGLGDQQISLEVLTPDDVGLTTQEQPSLFWYQSQPAQQRFELTLLQEDEIEPIVEVSFNKSGKAGIQRLRLADHGVKLAAGVEYQWVVALVIDPDNRSSDLVASGVIKRVEPSSDLTGRLKEASPTERAGVYAESGIWYDALSALTDQIESDPDNEALLAARADLLKQVDLKIAANGQN